LKNYNAKDHPEPLHAVRVLAWELTQACNLACPYCRGSAGRRAQGELSSEEALEALSRIKRLGRPLLILTGGEPLMRADVFEIIEQATAMGFPTALATNGTLLDEAVARRLARACVRRVSASLDFPDASRHDRVRGAGSFAAALEGIRRLETYGVPFQVNMTVGRENAHEIPQMLALAERAGAAAFHLFFVVDVGRARAGRQGLAPGDYEAALKETAALERTARIEMRVTCAPQYIRVRREAGLPPAAGRPAAGCMAGRGVLFISATGEVKPCGYFDLVVGRLADGPLDELWRNSPVFRSLRRTETFGGACGTCIYRDACGGCRARSYAETGNFLSGDPACVYNL